MNCDLNYDDWKIIGAGGFATIYLRPEGDIVKAIYSKDACDEAEIELNKHRKIYQLFQNLNNLSLENNKNNDQKLLNLIKKYVVVPKPGLSCNRPIKIGYREFSCFYTMERLRGISLKMLKEANPESIQKMNPSFIQSRTMDFELTIHLSFNHEFMGKIYGVNNSKTKISDQNPPRGYFINEHGTILEYFRNNYGLKLSNQEIKEIIGFVYGIIYFYGKIVPIDIEFGLGYYNGEFKINVLDFGMTVDLSDIDKSPRTVNTQEIIKTALSDQSPDKKILTSKTIKNLSMDMYCDIEEDDYCEGGWEKAKKLSEIFV